MWHNRRHKINTNINIPNAYALRLVEHTCANIFGELTSASRHGASHAMCAKMHISACLCYANINKLESGILQRSSVHIANSSQKYNITFIFVMRWIHCDIFECKRFRDYVRLYFFSKTTFNICNNLHITK